MKGGVDYATKKKRCVNIKRRREQLQEISRSRTETHARVQRARILLRYDAEETIADIARNEHSNRPVIERCIDEALSGGIGIALEDLCRSGRPPIISVEDKAWIIHVACSKPSEYGYAGERWTFSQLAGYIHKNAIEKGYPSLARTGKSAVYNILREDEIRPHKISYYLEKRDEQFEEKMAQVLFVYKEVQSKIEGDRKTATLSYDEKPGIQAIGNIAPDLAPVPERYSTWKKDHEYKRHGVLSLLAGIDLHDGHILGVVREHHRSKEFIEFLFLANNYYHEDWKIRMILDNHSAHIFKETMKWLKDKPNRFEVVYTPKHGSWLNIYRSLF